MKKIVATVLAMVMALALCTTAFAATAAGKDVEHAVATEGTEYALVKVLNAHDKVLDAYQIQTTVTASNGAKTVTLSAEIYSIATEDAYDYVIINGKEPTYLQSVPNTTTDTKVATKVATVKTAATDKKHGDIYTANDVALFTDADGVYYVPASAGTVYLNVGGKMVKAAVAATGDVTKVPHAFTADVTVKNGETTYSNIKCSCGASYNAYATTVAKAMTTFGVGGYEEITVSANGQAVTLYVAKTATPANGTTGTTTSPKTFDAGIAMYVGMALTSVAGSAVVIGKKKEF